VDADGAGPAAEAALLGKAQAKQRHDVRAVRVHRLRERRCVHARYGPRHVMADVPASAAAGWGETGLGRHGAGRAGPP
jgi:hypothetical protein